MADTMNDLDRRHHVAKLSAQEIGTRSRGCHGLSSHPDAPIGRRRIAKVLRRDGTPALPGLIRKVLTTGLPPEIKRFAGTQEDVSTKKHGEQLERRSPIRRNRRQDIHDIATGNARICGDMLKQPDERAVHNLIDVPDASASGHVEMYPDAPRATGRRARASARATSVAFAIDDVEHLFVQVPRVAAHAL